MDNPYTKYMFPVVNFYLLQHLHTRTKLIKDHGILTGVEPLGTIHLAVKENEYPPIIIVDKEHMVTEKNKEYALFPLNEKTELLEYLIGVSPKTKMKLFDALKENGADVDPKEDNLVNVMARSGIVFKPVQRIRHIYELEEIDWPQFVERLIRWDATEKDPRLNLAHKAQLLSGIESRLNAHALICTNAGTGKSIHYHINGVLIDKATRNAFLGYAKSPSEVYPGTVDGENLPIGIDQIEVGNWGIMDFMFNVMEYGEGTVSSGAVKFTVKSNAPFAFMANPISDKQDIEKGFGAILEHLTRNPAIGRRFGVFCYGTDYNVLTNRSTPESLDHWRYQNTFFRAIEAAAKNELSKIMKTKGVWDWINKEIPGYQQAFNKITDKAITNNVRTLFREHGKAGQSRVRAAALQCSLVDHLQDIVLKRYIVSDILEHAEETLSSITALNLESANNIIQNVGNEQKLFAEHWLELSPAYLKEIVYAVETCRRNGILGYSFSLNDIEYKPCSDSYSHLSQCISKLSKRKRGIAQFNEQCKKHFGFSFRPEGTQLIIFLENKTPIKWLEIPGTKSMNDEAPEKDTQGLEYTPQEKRSLVYDYINKHTGNGGVSTEDIKEQLNLTKTEVSLITSAGHRDGAFYEHLGKWRTVS